MGHAAFSPDGKLVVTASADKTARLWEVASGQVLRELPGHQDWVRHAAFSPDGKLVVTASDDKTARLWDVATGQALRELRGHQGAVVSRRFQSGRQAGSDGQQRQDRAAVGGGHWADAAGVARAPRERWCHAAFSPDGKLVVTASETTPRGCGMWPVGRRCGRCQGTRTG